jgi:hypothetical protein
MVKRKKHKSKVKSDGCPVCGGQYYKVSGHMICRDCGHVRNNMIETHPVAGKIDPSPNSDDLLYEEHS